MNQNPDHRVVRYGDRQLNRRGGARGYRYGSPHVERQRSSDRSARWHVGHPRCAGLVKRRSSGSSGRHRSTCPGHARVQRLAPSRQRERTLRWPPRVSTHLRGVLVNPAILLRPDQGGCARSSDGPHGQNTMALVVRGARPPLSQVSPTRREPAYGPSARRRWNAAIRVARTAAAACVSAPPIGRRRLSARHPLAWPIAPGSPRARRSARICAA